MVAATLRLALDQNFPTSLISQIGAYLPVNVELRSLQQIDPRLTTLDDRPLIVALRQLGWHGLITNNYKMLSEPHELAVIVRTRCVVIAVQGLGHDPLRAAGALLLELPGIEQRLVVDRSNVVLINYRQRPAQDGWDFLAKTAKHRGEPPNALWRRHRPSDDELNDPVL